MTKSLLLAFVPFLLIGCGGSDDSDGHHTGSNQTLETGIPPETVANEVTPAQTEALCSAFKDLAEGWAKDPRWKEGNCRFAGQVAASLAELSGKTRAEACKQTHDRCMASPVEEQSSSILVRRRVPTAPPPLARSKGA